MVEITLKTAYEADAFFRQFKPLKANNLELVSVLVQLNAFYDIQEEEKNPNIETDYWHKLDAKIRAEISRRKLKLLMFLENPNDVDYLYSVVPEEECEAFKEEFCAGDLRYFSVKELERVLEKAVEKLPYTQWFIEALNLELQYRQKGVQQLPRLTDISGLLPENLLNWLDISIDNHSEIANLLQNINWKQMNQAQLMALYNVAYEGEEILLMLSSHEKNAEFWKEQQEKAIESLQALGWKPIVYQNMLQYTAALLDQKNRAEAEQMLVETVFDALGEEQLQTLLNLLVDTAPEETAGNVQKDCYKMAISALGKYLS